MIEQGREARDELTKEFKRLRREHYTNLKDVEQMMVSFRQLSSKVQFTTDRIGLNDQALASVFKILRLNYALEEQDEMDRQSIILMGFTGANKNDKSLEEWKYQ